jgi:hypothetical protein
MLLYGGNQVLLSDYTARNTYYDNLLQLILEHEPVEVAVEYVNKLTPNVHCPNHTGRRKKSKTDLSRNEETCSCAE